MRDNQHRVLTFRMAP